MAIHQEVLDILKQKLLPELQGMKDWRTQTSAELKVVNGRLHRIDKRFEEIVGETRSRFDAEQAGNQFRQKLVQAEMEACLKKTSEERT